MPRNRPGNCIYFLIDNVHEFKHFMKNRNHKFIPDVLLLLVRSPVLYFAYDIISNKMFNVLALLTTTFCHGFMCSAPIKAYALWHCHIFIHIDKIIIYT
jgi:hypothetical protein